MVQNLKTKKIKYAIQYLRVSTLVQGKEDKTGIARQEDGFQRWLGQHPDYTPWDEKFEDIGKSAFKSYKTRGALLAILDLAEKGHLERIPILLLIQCLPCLESLN